MWLVISNQFLTINHFLNEHDDTVMELLRQANITSGCASYYFPSTLHSLPPRPIYCPTNSGEKVKIKKCIMNVLRFSIKVKHLFLS